LSLQDLLALAFPGSVAPTLAVPRFTLYQFMDVAEQGIVSFIAEEGHSRAPAAIKHLQHAINQFLKNYHRRAFALAVSSAADLTAANAREEIKVGVAERLLAYHLCPCCLGGKDVSRPIDGAPNPCLS